MRSSPRMWGCFQIKEVKLEAVFGLPHACGGVSNDIRLSVEFFESSPRMWGCFPAYRGSHGDSRSLPHACGGVSTSRDKAEHALLSSPRMWGCFLFGLRLNYFLIGLPHACGGVSSFRGSPNCLMLSSPRMWGCFCKCFFQVFIHTVFPTHVGVFLAKSLSPIRIQRLPHACGGVSDFRGNRRTVRASSPRMWGCFLWAV